MIDDSHRKTTVYWHWLISAVKRPANAGQQNKRPFSRTPHVHAKLMRFRELKVERRIPVWAGFSLHVLTNHLRDALPAAVGFTDASWNPTEPAEVDATDRRKKTAKLASVWITSFS